MANNFETAASLAAAAAAERRGGQAFGPAYEEFAAYVADNEFKWECIQRTQELSQFALDWHYASGSTQSWPARSYVKAGLKPLHRLASMEAYIASKQDMLEHPRLKERAEKAIANHALEREVYGQYWPDLLD